IALGIGLDDSEMVRQFPAYSGLWKACESDDERKVRLAVLGNPTVRFRRDLCQHFAVSAALTALEGPAKAEAFGLMKEVLDMEKVAAPASISATWPAISPASSSPTLSSPAAKSSTPSARSSSLS